MKSMDTAIRKLEQDLLSLGGKTRAKEYLAGAAKISLLAFILAWLLWNLFFSAPVEGLAFSALCGACAFFFIFGRPRARLERKARLIEKHLPFALMQLSVELNIGIPFEKALSSIAGSNYGVLSIELKRALIESRSGASVTEALTAMCERNRSRLLSRSIAQLASIYEKGGKKEAGEAVRSLAKELLSRQKAEAKEFYGKAAVYSLAFIVVSAIVPALFQAFVMVGSGFMETGFEPEQVLLIVALLFPLADTLLLFSIKAGMPESMRQ